MAVLGASSAGDGLTAMGGVWSRMEQEPEVQRRVVVRAASQESALQPCGEAQLPAGSPGHALGRMASGHIFLVALMMGKGVSNEGKRATGHTDSRIGHISYLGRFTCRKYDA